MLWTSYFTNYKFCAFHVTLFTHVNGCGNKGGKHASHHSFTQNYSIHFSIMTCFMMFGPERYSLFIHYSVAVVSKAN